MLGRGQLTHSTTKTKISLCAAGLPLKRTHEHLKKMMVTLLFISLEEKTQFSYLILSASITTYCSISVSYKSGVKLFPLEYWKITGRGPT